MNRRLLRVEASRSRGVSSDINIGGYSAAGRRAESDEALRELVAKYGEDCACQIAELHATRGETSAAFEWLERAYRQRDSGLTLVKFTPHLRSLHGDPRCEAFMKKMGFEGCLPHVDRLQS